MKTYAQLNMNCLIIDTTSSSLIVAVLKGEQVFSTSQKDCGLRHSTTINLAVEKALQDANLSFEDLDVLACCIGPGSFTGIRIGVATAKGLKTALDNLKLVSFTSLNALAYNCQGECHCAMDAGNGLYYAKYDKTKCLHDPCLIDYCDTTGWQVFDNDCFLLQQEIDLVKDLIAEKAFVENLSPLYIRKSQAELNKK